MGAGRLEGSSVVGDLCFQGCNLHVFRLLQRLVRPSHGRVLVLDPRLPRLQPGIPRLSLGLGPTRHLGQLGLGLGPRTPRLFQLHPQPLSLCRELVHLLPRCLRQRARVRHQVVH